MQKYNAELADAELKTLESVLALGIEEYLESNDILNAARGLIAVNKELYKLEEDARRLRLTGELDFQVYSALRNGYARIADRLMRIAQGYQYSREVLTLQKALRFSNEAPSLSDYIREVEE